MTLKVKSFCSFLGHGSFAAILNLRKRPIVVYVYGVKNIFF